MTHFLEEMLNPESVVVYGASGPMKMGTMQALAIVGSGFPGKVEYVHPKLDRVLGQKAYRNVNDIPGNVDLAVIVVPAPAVPNIIRDLGRKGVGSAVVTTAGFKEVATKEGRGLHDEMMAAARQSGVRIVGPNCLGLVNAHLPLNTTTFPAQLVPGSISLASHSGSYTTQIFPYMEELEPGIGLRYAFSLGNEADVDIVDALDCFREDDETKVVCLYIEGIRRGREFIEAAKKTSMKKPVVAHYVGGNEAGARSGSSHTAAMGTPDDLVRGIFRQCGVVPADGVEELFDFARILSQSPEMPGNRVGIVTNSGGPGSTAAYSCERAGLSLPVPGDELRQKIGAIMPGTGSTGNPIDFTFDTDMNRFKNVTKLMLESDDYDAVLVYGLFMGGFFGRRKDTYSVYFPEIDMEPMLKMVGVLVKGVADLKDASDKPLVMSSMMTQMEDGFRIFTDAGVPSYVTPERAARALGALSSYWSWRRLHDSDG